MFPPDSSTAAFPVPGAETDAPAERRCDADLDRLDRGELEN